MRFMAGDALALGGRRMLHGGILSHVMAAAAQLRDRDIEFRGVPRSYRLMTIGTVLNHRRMDVRIHELLFRRAMGTMTDRAAHRLLEIV